MKLACVTLLLALTHAQKSDVDSEQENSLDSVGAAQEAKLDTTIGEEGLFTCITTHKLSPKS